LPRPLHPAAWWCWALGLAVAASRTTNPVLLALLLGVVGYVVVARRGEAPWARGFHAYLLLGLVVVAIRVAYRIVLGGDFGTHVIVRLPEIPLPDAARGIRLGGPVTLESVLAAVYDGLRLATLLICVGAANVLADPRRLLKALPAALHEIGVAVTVSLSVAPQLVESGQRVRRARRLRGEPGRRLHLVRTVIVPVMTDALDRSLMLAAAMDTRGHGRVAGIPTRTRRLSSAALLVGLCGVCVGTYALLDGTVSRWIGIPAMVLGLGLSVTGVVVGNRRIATTVYRADPWQRPEWFVAACGVVVALGLVAVARVSAGDLNPSAGLLEWPVLPVAAFAVVLLGALPVVVAA
jgi:energy-coupling factor transport system permease protein